MDKELSRKQFYSLAFAPKRKLLAISCAYKMDAGYISVLDEGTPNEGILYPRVYDSNWTGRDTTYVVARETSTPQNFADTTMVIFKASSKGLPLELLFLREKKLMKNQFFDGKLLVPKT